jgi:TP901 family phage tail tape measure protein
MASVFTLGVIVRVIDRYSAPFRSFRAMLAGHRDQLRQMGQDMKAWGKAALVAGAVIGGALAAPTMAFASLEAASTQLRTTLMDSRGGLPTAFAEIERKAIALGNRLPGTTEDFLRMASIMGAKGQSADTIAGGLLEAAGLLGVVLKPLGATYESTAESVAIFGNALGIASKDMVPFTDVVQRAAFLGVELGDMTYAVARSAPALKILGVQGLEASRDLVPLIAMLNAVGIRGEMAGTGLNAMLTQLSNPMELGEINQALGRVGLQLHLLDKDGKFLGIQNMIGELEKLQKLNPAQFAVIMEKIFGGGGDAGIARTIIAGGLKGYGEIAAKMRGQADLQMKVNESLGTLANVLDAATGTLKNTLAEFGKLISPELKAVVTWLGDVSAATGAWIKGHPQLVRWLVVFLGIAAGLTVVLGGLAVAIGAVITAIGGTAAAIAIGVVAALAAAIAALVVFWDDLTAAVKSFWNALKGGFGLFNAFVKGWAWLTGGKPVEIDYTGGAADLMSTVRGGSQVPAGGVGAGRGPVTINFGGVNIADRATADYFTKRVVDAIEGLSDGMPTAQAIP